ncbi:HEAT repeat domain-containing protein [Streptomyces sp. NBC_01304]|uniref:HEAT repeat domain-containing protein n=1 Tax=Streptomyces sp. NBC_01304 TaxID=2903818 RepID=UPI002E1012CE|nr:HEAT repeat domain-containing protein [Streptomyces sp. NBC_01304]
MTTSPTDHGFGQLLKDDDPRRRHQGLLRLAAHPAAGPAEEAALAALLPTSVAEPAEAALVQAGLHERLGRHLEGARHLQWRTADLPVRVQVAWLRAELLNDAAVVRNEPAGELLHQAVRSTDLAAAHRPDELVSALADSTDPVLRPEALRLVRQGLHTGLLAPARVRARLAALVEGRTATAVLRELAEPWAALEPWPRERFTPFLAADAASAEPGRAEAALAAVARHGHGDVLRTTLEDPDLPPALRRRALELLGDLAERGDIPGLTSFAGRDPLLFGGPLVTCLRGLHRRGHFPSDAQAGPVVALALADHSIPAGEVATILFTCRQEMFRALTGAAPDDPSWPRRLDLLVALAGQGLAGDPPIGDAITDVLPLTPAPAPFLHALRTLRHTPAEDAVLALLPAHPGPVLDALEAIGGERTAAALRAGLCGAGPIAPPLRAVRHRALALLWQLTDDPAGRRKLLDRLDPADLPGPVAADLGGPDERELAFLRAHLDPEQPVAALCRLAAHGGADLLPVLADLVLRIVAEQAAFLEPGGPEAVRTRDELPADAPAVPQEVLDAIRALGARLHRRGRIRPVCLLDAAGPDEAGHALVADLALGLLDRDDLGDGEQSILLELLLRAPSPHIRPRVHRLLRHRDRHVRKQVIALLGPGQGTSGDDAQALSATLITLTRAEDVQTVRQSLLALGRARADWAAGAIAECLDHPAMNIKKTAAEVLSRAGAPAAVPKLLYWLGHHGNPGLRSAVLGALRQILGDAWAATLIAAAERAEDARELLILGLDRALSARAVAALHAQGSPVAPALLALLAEERIRLATGELGELAPLLAEHGHAVPAPAEPDVETLFADGWHPEAALRIAALPQLPHPLGLRTLRPLLADWLELAAARPADRDRLLRVTLLLCPAPWAAWELSTYARFKGVLLAGLAEASGADRDGLLAVLEAVAAELPAAEAPEVLGAVRALPPAPAGVRSTLPLLRALGAVLVRADLDRALASAGLTPDPRRAEVALLHEAFGASEPVRAAERADEEWRASLTEAARTPDALREFRRRSEDSTSAVLVADGTTGAPGTTGTAGTASGTVGRPPSPPDSRTRLTALIDLYPDAGQAVRAALLGWMTALQPLDTPAWILTETGDPSTDVRPRVVAVDDLDQPRSAAQFQRLAAMLEAPGEDRRNAAAGALLDWPEPETRLLVLRAFLRGRVTVPVSGELVRPLPTLGKRDLQADGVRPDRLLQAAAALEPAGLEPLLPLLLDQWEHGSPALRVQAAGLLHRVPADVLAQALEGQLAAGRWGFVDLLLGRTLLRTPALARTLERLRAEGRDAIADRILLVDGPLRGPDSAAEDAAALSALLTRTPPGTPAGRTTREETRELARTGTPEQVRRALTRLTEDRDPELAELIGELLHHPKPGIRLHAHRAARTALDRAAYLAHTALLLDDPEPNVVRMAVQTLGHAAWEPAIPAVTALLAHPHPVVRRAAADGLVRIGTPAVPALRHASAHARPDRRERYTAVLDRIEGAADD